MAQYTQICPRDTIPCPPKPAKNDFSVISNFKNTGFFPEIQGPALEGAAVLSLVTNIERERQKNLRQKGQKEDEDEYAKLF
jgi:hypothetical protein